jgi:hypothetical protein
MPVEGRYQHFSDHNVLGERIQTIQSLGFKYNVWLEENALKVVAEVAVLVR